MSRLFTILFAACICTLVVTAVWADTFVLTDGTAVTGELIPTAADLNGIQVRVDSTTYQRIPWSKLSQEDLKKLKDQFSDNPKMVGFINPFLDEVARPRPKIEVKEVTRLDRPANISLIGAMVSSSVGLTVLLLLYAANIYAGYEIARFRSRPAGLVCGVSAVAPVVGPIIFLSMPAVSKEPEYVAPEVTASHQQTFNVAGATTAPGEHSQTGGLRISQAGGHAQTRTIPETQVFARGHFMFNRRFFETKFPGFFGLVRRDADRDMVLAFKTARGEYIGQRIARITANELHLEIIHGGASQEVMIPFNDIKEIQLKHKDA